MGPCFRRDDTEYADAPTTIHSRSCNIWGAIALIDGCMARGISMSDFVIEEGLPYPLGATWSGKGTNFAVFSANATKVEVCIFEGDRETHRFELPEYTDQ